MVSVCLPSDALLQHLLSYLDFSYLGRGISLHGGSGKAQPLLLTLEEGYLLTTTLPDLQHGIAPLGPPAPTQPRLLGCGVAPPGLRRGAALPGSRPWPWARVAPLRHALRPVAATEGNANQNQLTFPRMDKINERDNNIYCGK